MPQVLSDCSRGYTRIGFDTNLSLTEVFTNEYTKMNGEMPVVRAMTKEDIDTVYGTTESWNLSETAYSNLFVLGDEYWLASFEENNTGLYWVSLNGFLNLNDEAHGCYGIRVVVSLKPEVRVTTQDASGAWNIEMP